MNFVLCWSLRGRLVATKEDHVSSRLNPYISFDGNARSAMEFYESVFGGTLTLNTFGEFGGQDGPGADKIMHGMLETPSGFTLMGADTPPGMEHSPGNNIAVSLSGDDADELRGYWEKLSAERHRHGPAGEADVGRRVRHVHRPVRHRVDGQHRSAAGLNDALGPGRRERNPPWPAQYEDRLGDVGMRVRDGQRGESVLLSDLALRSKSYWGYDADFLDACREELRLRPDDFDRFVVRVAEDDDGRIAGFYAIGEVDEEQGEIRFFFVDLPFIGSGIGRRLFDDLIEIAGEAGLRTLTIDADPGAAAFYERMGAEPAGQVPSGSIPGRSLPHYRLQMP